MHRFGVMQGRLLPKYKGRYQAHPVGYWQDEFPVAARLGLSCIEFILDFNDAEQNPLMSDSGLAAIRRIVDQTGVAVRSVCADYFMEAPIHDARPEVAAASLRTAEVLLENASQLGVTDIVIPCVDHSSLRTNVERDRFARNIQPLIPLAEKAGINLALETDLAPAPFVALLAQLNSPRVTANYDLGNSAALGYRVAEEFAAYGPRISDIHIKDRKLGGGSVVLGAGHADFQAFFRELARLNFAGPMIMQAFRDDEGVPVFERQLQWLLRTGAAFFVRGA